MLLPRSCPDPSLHTHVRLWLGPAAFSEHDQVASLWVFWIGICALLCTFLLTLSLTSLPVRGETDNSNAHFDQWATVNRSMARGTTWATIVIIVLDVAVLYFAGTSTPPPTRAMCRSTSCPNPESPRCGPRCMLVPFSVTANFTCFGARFSSFWHYTIQDSSRAPQYLGAPLPTRVWDSGFGS